MEEQLRFYENKLKYEMDSADLFEDLNSGEKLVVIDARKPFAFEEEHIPGAINFPHRTMSEDTTKNLDKNIVYVTYCDGIGCNASTKAALNLTRLGFKVKELIGGIAWWKSDGYEVVGSKAVTGGQKVQCAC